VGVVVVHGGGSIVVVVRGYCVGIGGGGDRGGVKVVFSYVYYVICRLNVIITQTNFQHVQIAQ